MRWRVIVPLKAEGSRKSRLAERLSESERAALGLAMFGHVVAVAGAVAPVTVLSETRPDGWSGAWRPDRGRGLNAELEAARADAGTALAVVHADLPLLAEDDVRALLAAAGGRLALAPDRHDAGTNALAIPPGRALAFVFGADSFARFAAQHRDAAILRRHGLALDIDTPADLDAAGMAATAGGP